MPSSSRRLPPPRLFWPHPKWGKDDQAGASKLHDAGQVLDTVKLIKDGKVYRIGRVYENAMPSSASASSSCAFPARRPAARSGANKLIYHDEFLSTEIGQTAPSSTGLGNIGIQMGKDGDQNEMRYYNGVSSSRLQRLWAEEARHGAVQAVLHPRPLFDVEAVKGNPMDVGQEITVADLRSALQKQNMQEADIKEGDAVFFNTGFGKLWIKNNDKFNSGEPGIGLEVAKWCIDKGVCMTGADTWATEVVPNPNKDLAFRSIRS